MTSTTHKDSLLFVICQKKKKKLTYITPSFFPIKVSLFIPTKTHYDTSNVTRTLWPLIWVTSHSLASLFHQLSLLDRQESWNKMISSFFLRLSVHYPIINPIMMRLRANLFYPLQPKLKTAKVWKFTHIKMKPQKRTMFPMFCSSLFPVKMWANTIITESSPESSHSGLILRTLI